MLFCSEKVALQALKASDWHLEGAFDIFYSQPQIRSVTDSRHLEELYHRYKGDLFSHIELQMANKILRCIPSILLVSRTPVIFLCMTMLLVLLVYLH